MDILSELSTHSSARHAVFHPLTDRYDKMKKIHLMLKDIKPLLTMVKIISMSHHATHQLSQALNIRATQNIIMKHKDKQ